MNGKMIRSLCLAAMATWCVTGTPALAQASATDRAEITFWETARDSGNPEMLRAYLETYAHGEFRPLAEIMLKEIAKAETAEARADITTCDRLAGHPDDEQATASGSNFADLKSHSEEAIKACTRSAQSGEPRQTFQLGRAYLASGEERLAMLNYKKAADAGYRRAAYWYAEYLAEGRYGLTPDGQTAMTLHKKNAAAGDAESQFRVGWLYFSGESGIARNRDEAAKALTKAEQMGTPSAYYPLGYLYEKGQGGLPASTDKAMAYYRHSIEKKTFYWTTARRRLIDLLERQVNSDTLSLQGILDSKAAMTELFALYRQRRGDKVEGHTEYASSIAGLVNRLSTALGVALVWDRSDLPAMDPKLRPEAVSIRDATIDLLFVALAERQKAFPDAFPKQTSDRLKSERTGLTKRIKEAEEKLTAYLAETRYAGKKANRASGCVKLDTRWRDHDYRIVVKNRCKYAVKVEAEYGVRYGSSRYANIKDTDRMTIRAGGDHSITVFAKNADKEGFAFTKSCFAVQGYPEDADQPDQFVCPAPKNWAKETSVTGKFDAIGDFVKSLAEGNA